MNKGKKERAVLNGREPKEEKRRLRLTDILKLQAVIVLYTFSSVMAKLASAQEAFTVSFFAFYGTELLILGLYALLWQQMIKRFELSLAYINRSMALLWSLLWAVVLFHDSVTLKNGIGVALVVAGTLIANSGGDTTE